MWPLARRWMAIYLPLLIATLWGRVAEASYALKHAFHADSQNFFDEFYFRDRAYFESLKSTSHKSDPSNGFVNYLGFDEANKQGLIGYQEGGIYLGVDSQSVISEKGPGRSSVRLESKWSFSNGLLIADIAHMPGNACGIWPAFWTFNFSEEPYGEIDVIEGSTFQNMNRVSLHTCASCSFASNSTRGLNKRLDCDLHAGDSCNEPQNPDGCGVSGKRGSFGDSFNRRGGGVYALMLDDTVLKIWSWKNTSVPEDIRSGNPDPSTWSSPMMDFRSSDSSCSVKRHWRKQSLVINIDFCGDGISGSSWKKDSRCYSQEFPTCQKYVAANPDAYREAYWLFNSIKLYHKTVTDS